MPPPVARSRVARAEPSTREIVHFLHQTCTAILNLRDKQLAQRAVERVYAVFVPYIVLSLRNTTDLTKIEEELGRLRCVSTFSFKLI